jgi:predicted RNA-binding Zn ribbon-like protein
MELEDTLEFINTLEHSRDGDSEHLPSVAAAVAWMTARGALDATPGITTETDLTTIREARAAYREVADALVLRRPADPGAVKVVNRVLVARDVPELRSTLAGVALGARQGRDPIAAALARLAEPLVEIVETGHVERLRICANADCRWVFYDVSPTARRRWCDMTTCGNRAKAARHRARRRAGDAEATSLPTDAPPDDERATRAGDPAAP